MIGRALRAAARLRLRRRARGADPVAPGAPPPARTVARLAPYSVRAAGRRGLLRLDFNENLLGPSPRVLERLRAIQAEDVSLYPDETRARDAVASRFGVRPPLDLVLTSGVDQGIRLVCDCFVRPGDRVILLEPGYPMYRFYATLAGARVAGVACGPDLGFPATALRRAVARGCRLLILGHPHNPTGRPIPPGLVAELAARRPRTVVLIDEAYVEFAGGSSVPLLRRFRNLVVARSFSKAYGLAGLRAGVLLGHRDTLSWVARMRSPYAVNALALLALEEALQDDACTARYAAEVRAARTVLAAGLARLGVPSAPSAANFLIARPGPRAASIAERLRARGILVRDRSDHPLLHGTLRIGVGTRRQARTFLRALARVLAEARLEARRRGRGARR